MRWTFILIALAVLASPVSADVLLEDQFDGYSPGPLPDAPWTRHAGSAGQEPFAAAAAVDLDYTRDGQVHRTLNGGPLGNGTMIYAGFTVRATAPAGPGTFAHFRTAGGATIGRVFVLPGVSGRGGSVAFGVSNGGSLPDQIVPQDFPEGGKVTIVICVDQTGLNPKTTIWLNPIDELSTGITATDPISNADLASFALRQDSDIGTVRVDDLTAADTFNEVMPVTIEFTIDNPTPDPVVVANNATVVIASFTASASGGPVTISDFSMRPGDDDTANHLTDIATDGVTVYRDDGDGVFSAALDSAMAPASDYNQSWPLQFTGLADNVVLAGTTARFFVVYQLNGNAVMGATFTINLGYTVSAAFIGDVEITGRTVEMADSGGSVGGGSGCTVTGGSPASVPVLLLVLIGLITLRRVHQK